MAKRTPLKAIRAKCIDCCGGQMNEVRLCTIPECALYEHKMGRRPKDDNLSTEKDKTSKTSRSHMFFTTEGTI